MKVAVVGGGIAGLAVCQGLAEVADVTLFESSARLGGHTDTHNLLVDGRSYAIDSGFSAFNRESFPRYSAWLDDLGVVTRATSMSFGVDLGGSAQYGTADLGALFARRSNWVSPRFLRMLIDISRFFRDARKLIADADQTQADTAFGSTLGAYVGGGSYAPGFVEEHLMPLCGALWSMPEEQIRELPLQHVLTFMLAHNMLQFDDRPEWLVIDGGANSYVSAFLERAAAEVRLASPVLRVERNPGTVRVMTASTDERFDRVVFACPADQVLALIDPSPEESRVLGAFRYRRNRVLIHSDASFMPALRRTWSSWNVVGTRMEDAQVTCWANRLQQLDSSQDFFITLNPRHTPTQIWSARDYDRPVFTQNTQWAQRQRGLINGVNRSFFAGAYWGYGTHEDGFVSGIDVVTDLAQAASAAA